MNSCSSCLWWHSIKERRNLLWQMSSEESDIYLPLAKEYKKVGINLNKPYDDNGSGFCMVEKPEKITIDRDTCGRYAKR